ncbi:MAG: helix-hairpin-helix domain-containing protein [Rubritalea sp.]|uniref:helix-hairpin-helix domain-containing protein n=1 Tax=Rubritalea sp. TaxID=2109375 RepID=UPI003241FC54
MPLTISCLLSYYSPMLLQNPNRFIKVSTHSAIQSYFTLIAVVFLIGVSTQIEAANLQTIEGCKLVDANWSDGDSFPIVTPNHKKFTVRLYGADALESTITNTTDARRLRAQRRYFGITKANGSSQASIQLSKQLGDDATKLRKQLLAKPFTVYTALADARGDRRYKRYYAFITLNDGRDLASVLVEKGLARAYGVYRRTWDNRDAKTYEASLKDLEMLAAKKERGIWAHTDWDDFISARESQREEDRLVSMALDSNKVITQSISINTSSRDELMQLSGIGETTANAIIEGRPFKQITDITKVRGIGPKTLEKLKPFITL